MENIKIENDEYRVVAHDTIVTFEEKPTLIDISHPAVPESIGSVPPLKLKISFIEDGGSAHISTSPEEGVGRLNVKIYNARKSPTMTGPTSLIKVGSLKSKDGSSRHEIYLNCVFVPVNNSYWFSYTIFLKK